MSIRTQMWNFLNTLDGQFILTLHSLDDNYDITVRSKNWLDQELSELVPEEEDICEVVYPGDSLPWVSFLTDVQKKELLDRELDHIIPRTECTPIQRQRKKSFDYTESKSFTPADDDKPACWSDFVGNHYSYDIFRIISQEELNWMENRKPDFKEDHDCEDVLILDLTDPRCSELVNLIGKDQLNLNEWFTFVLKINRGGKIMYLTDPFHEWFVYFTPVCEDCHTKTKLCHCEDCETRLSIVRLCECVPHHGLNER